MVKRKPTRKKVLYDGTVWKGAKEHYVMLTPTELKRARRRSEMYFAGKLAKTHKMG